MSAPAEATAADGLAPAGRIDAVLDRVPALGMAVALFALALVVYLASNPERRDFYDHFVWQADAFLHGRAEIAYPVSQGAHRNDYFQDVLPVGPDRAQIPFPPLPALVLLPFVAVFGLDTNGAMVAAILGALNVSLCWLMLLSVTSRRSAALLATLFYGFGTVAWYAAMLGSTWFLAHVIASSLLFTAIHVAVRADPASIRQVITLRRGPSVAALPGAGPADPETPGPAPGAVATPTRPSALAEGPSRQLAAGLLFGLAGLARLTTLFGAPFFGLVGAGGSTLRRALAAGTGTLLPVALLLAYNLATTGHLFHPAYEHLYDVEYRPRPAFIHEDWAIEDVRYIPQNAVIMLAWPPQTPLVTDPACFDRGLGPDVLLDRDCPIVRPDPLGMSLLLVSPAYLLALPVLLRWWRRRLVAGAGLAVLAIALIDLAHFSQGWVQFGYRFSNDLAPFAVILVALGIARRGVGWLSLGLVALSIAVNAWGVWWGVTLGW